MLCIEAERSASVVHCVKLLQEPLLMSENDGPNIFALQPLCGGSLCFRMRPSPPLYKAVGQCCMQHFVEYQWTTTEVDYCRRYFMKSVQTTDASMGCFSFITLTLLTCIPSIHWMLVCVSIMLHKYRHYCISCLTPPLWQVVDGQHGQIHLSVLGHSEDLQWNNEILIA